MSRLWRTLTSPWWVANLAVLAVYVLAAHVLPPKPILEFVRIALLGINGAIVIAYWGPATAAMARAEKRNEDFLVIGIWRAWSAQFLVSVLTLLWRVAGQPAWLLNNDLIGFALVTYAMAGIDHGLGALNGVPRRSVIIVGFVLSFSIVGMFAIGLFSPQFARFVQMLRPYLDEGEDSRYSTPQNLVVPPLYLDGAERRRGA